MAKARVQRIWTVGILTMTALVAVTIGFSAYVTAAAYNKTKNLEPTGGEVSLRSYFQKGSGIKDDPFVISRPIHFYNLSRLQNLGVFSSQTFFVLGYDPNHPNDIHGDGIDTDLTFYKDNTSNELVTDHTLDMSKISSLTDAIAPIGDEQAPFYGDFDGHGLAIKGLNVSSRPEDVGVFGYTYSGSSVHDLYLIDPVVTDDGYENNIEISPLFSDPNNVAYAGSVAWNSGQSKHTGEPSSATSLSDNEEVDFLSDNKIKITATLPNLTSSMPNVTCEYRLSSPLVTATAVQGNQITDFVFNKDLVTAESDYEDFATCPDGGTFHVRLSLVASCVTSSGLHYSKTISSYLIVLIRHGEVNNSTFSYQVIKDTFDGQTNGFTQYRHGANIGLLCGHAEGSFTNCFVYGGTISLNNQKNGVTSLVQESETGLFGEIGASVDSSISPQKNYEGDKDTGVLNFSKMYEDIAAGDHSEVISGGTTYFNYTPGMHREVFVATDESNEFQLSYTPAEPEDDDDDPIDSVEVDGVAASYTRNGSTITITGGTLEEGDTVSVYYKSTSADKFKPYLRNNRLSGSNLRYATKFENSVDFIGQRVIEDTENDKSKGMGVFSLVTTASQSDTNGTYAVNELGDFVIKKDISNNEAETYTDFYYTTAEWNADPDGDGQSDYIDISNWNDISDTTEIDDKHYHINQPSTFPTTITPSTWNPYFERYFNYNIHCSLSPNSTVNNYFWNTGSEFLKSYFSYKLVNSSGVAPEHLTAPFGVFVRNINPDTGAESAITKFDSVLEISEDPEKKFASLPFQYSESFEGNGKDRFFELKHIPVNNVKVYLDEVLTNSHTTTGNQLSFNTPPANGTKIHITYDYQNPTKSVVFSIKNSGGANVTIFAASNSETEEGGYVGIYKTSRGSELYEGSNVTSKPDYAMYCPYYPAAETLERAGFHYYDYNYATGETSITATEATPSQANRLYAHTFYLKQGEYIVSSPEGKAQLVYICAQGQNGKGNTGLNQPNGINAISNVDFIATDSDPKKLTLDRSTGELTNRSSVNVRCYFSFNSIWDNSTTNVAGKNDLHVITGLSENKPTIDITAGKNLTYLLADNEGRFKCSFTCPKNDEELLEEEFERQFYEYTRPQS